MGPLAFDCWCCVTSRSDAERSPVPGLCADCAGQFTGAEAWEGHRLAVRAADVECPECGARPCVCEELKAQHAPSEECCTFCGDAASFRVGEWNACHRIRCNERASTGPAAVTPWWEGVLAGREA